MWPDAVTIQTHCKLRALAAALFVALMGNDCDNFSPASGSIFGTFFWMMFSASP